MSAKKHIALFVFPLIALAGVVGVWRWGGDLLENRDAPRREPDGRLDHAEYINRTLEKLSPSEQNAFLYAYLGTLSPDELGNALGQWKAIRPRDRARVLEIAALRGGETAPEATRKSLMEITPFPERAERALFVGWGARDFDAARTAVESVGKEKRRNALAGELFKARAKIDPRAAALCAMAEIYEKKDPGLSDILELWGESDPRAAVDFALANDRAKRLGRVFANWLSRDPAAATARLRAMSPAQQQESVAAVLANDFFTRFNPAQAKALIEQFPAPDPKKQERRYVNFYLQCACVDPEGTVREVLALRNKQLQEKVMGAVLSELGDVNPPAVLEVLREWLPTASPPARVAAIQRSIWEPLRDNPLAVLAFFGELPPSSEFEEWKAEVFRQVSPESFEEAKRQLTATEFSTDEGRAKAYRAMFNNLWKNDPKQAQAWMDSIPDRAAKSAAASALLERSPPEKFTERMELYKRLTQQEGLDIPHYNLFFFVEEIPEPQAAADWIRANLTARDKDFLLPALMRMTADKDISSALGIWEKTPEGSTKDEMTRELAQAMLEHSAQEAMLLASGVQSPELQTQLKLAIAIDTAKRDFDQGLALLKNPEVLDLMTAGTTDGWWQTNPMMEALVAVDKDRVLVTLDSLPENYREKMRTAYALCIAEIYPQTAIEILAQDPLGDGGNGFRNTFSEWSSRDPEGAMQWLGENAGEGKAFRAAGERGIISWLEYDPMAASQWLAQQGEGSFKEALTGALIRSEAAKDPEGAFAWALTIGEDKERLNQAKYVYARWRKTDPQSAVEAIEHSDLPTAEKAEILSQEGGSNAQ